MAVVKETFIAGVLQEIILKHNAVFFSAKRTATCRLK